MVTCLDLVQRALAIVERWCTSEELTDNPAKTVMVPFTNKAVVLNEMLSVLFGQKVLVTKEIQNLEIRLVNKLN